MKRIICFTLLIFVILTITISCKKNDLYGKYNAKSLSLYSSIEILPKNVAKILVQGMNPAIITTYERRDNFIFIKYKNDNLGFEIIDSTKMKGPGSIDNVEIVYDKNANEININGNIPIIAKGDSQSDGPVYVYIPSGKIKTKTKNEKSITISVNIGITQEDNISSKAELNEKKNMIAKTIEGYFSSKNSTDLVAENDSGIKNEIALDLNRILSHPIVREILFDEFYVEEN